MEKAGVKNSLNNSNMGVTIGNKKLAYPIIQGGMGIGISLGKLSGSVAKEGAMGTISAVGIGYREKDFYTHTARANIRALRKEVRKAKEIAQGKGLIGINLMVAVNGYQELIKAAVDEEIDFIISGAGLPLNLPELVGNRDILLAPIVSSVKALRVISTYWRKKHNRLPDFVVLEGSDAGGHLGFKEAELQGGSNLERLTLETLGYLEKLDKEIPLFVAGSLYDGYDLKKYKKLGAVGIQIGTRFIATYESDVADEFKELIVQSKEEDLAVIDSPVGMRARAIKNEFLERVAKERVPSSRCIRCLKTCNPKTTPYCISEALINSARGDVKNGLVFSGANVGRIEKMTSVKEIIAGIVREYQS